MIGSMWSGVSGLRTHQQRMDVIGNDIANVNTVGYKESDVTFKEQMVNVMQAPAERTQGRQVGMGVMIGGITRNFKDGVLMETQRSGNIAIGGGGFFEVEGIDGNNYYTRAGDFQLTLDGDRLVLANPNGDFLTDGQGAVVEFDLDIVDFSISVEGMVVAINEAGDPVEVGQIFTARFANPTGLLSVGHNLFQQVDDASGVAQFDAPGQPGHGELYQGYLENSNVDLAKEFVEMIITQRGFQANSRCITTSDEMMAEIMAMKR